MNVIRWNIFVLMSVLIQNVNIKNCEETNEDLKIQMKIKIKNVFIKILKSINYKIQLILIGKKKII